MYAVTNHHVACTGGSSVVRVNTTDGDSEVFEFGPDEWEFDPRFDIAVKSISLKSGFHAFASIPVEAFLSKSDVQRLDIGPGDDLFMVGRFVDIDVGRANSPAVRFGHLSTMPTPVEQPNKRIADVFCADIHSRTGYSGSPVFVYRTAFSDLEIAPSKDLADAKIPLVGTQLLMLLGINFAQFPEYWEIKAGDVVPDETGLPLIRKGDYVKGLSGMSCVLPAWSILEVLNLPALVSERARVNALWAKQSRPAVPDAMSTSGENGGLYPSNDENPMHREDFSRLLNVAAKTPPQDD